MPATGFAGIAMPASAPSTPASNDPARVVTSPFRYSPVCSPRYQTLPTSSCAYQSSVISTGSPFSVTVSRTTLASTPLAIILVSSVTSTTTFCRPPEVSVSR